MTLRLVSSLFIAPFYRQCCASKLEAQRHKHTHPHPKPTQMQLCPRLRSAFASIKASQQKDTLDHAINHI